MSDQWMGSIAAQDQYRPLGNDPWTNTMRGTTPAPGQGFMPEQASPVLYNTKAGPITEADIENTIGIGMGVSGGGLATKGIKAYHSSPHDFDKFDLAKIGSGEGAQVYGHGLYFAENPAVSGQGGQYWRQFLPRFTGPERTAATYLQSARFDREKAAQLMRDSLARDEARLPTFTPAELSDYRALTGSWKKSIELLESGQPVGPRTYEVNINADPAHMLDWDKPLSAQPHATKTIMDLLPAAERRRIERWEKPSWSEGDPKASYFDTVKGGTEYQGLAGILGKSDKASAALREAGIPGIKYLDQGSRGPQIQTINGVRSFVPRSNTSNYVIFDPNRITIEKKYGIPAAIGAGGMGALAAQDSYQPEERM